MTQKNKIRLFIVLALASLFATLWLPYVGEEGVYTISSYEMWFNHNYLINTLYGNFYGRPPLMNWLVIPVADWMGWSHVLMAARLVSATATMLTAFGLWWFSVRLTKNRLFSLFCAAIYLTGDLLMVRGWLAYADPLMSLFVFFSVAFLWLGVEEERNGFFWLASVFLTAAFLTKAFSPYWIYGLAGLVLLIKHPKRSFLLRPTSVIIHLLVLAGPFVWGAIAGHQYGVEMWQEAVNTAYSPSLGKYIYQVFIVHPGMLLLRLSPVSLLVAYCLVKKRQKKGEVTAKESLGLTATIALGVFALNFMVCWFAPRWPEPRYYMPVLPFIAIFMAYVVWCAGQRMQGITVSLLMLTLGVKVAMTAVFYYNGLRRAPVYQAAAEDINKIVSTTPVFVDADFSGQSATIEKVIIYLNLIRYPAPPITFPFSVYQRVRLTYFDRLKEAKVPFKPPARVVQKNNLPYTQPTQCRGRFKHHWLVGVCRHMYIISELHASPHDRIVAQYGKGRRQFYLIYRS